MDFFLIILKRLKNILRVGRGKQPQISIVVPFRPDTPRRGELLNWIRKYYRSHLPHAEFIIGFSNSHVFCKTEAFNNAVRRAKGKVIVLLDADAYIDTNTIQFCADRILEEIDNHLWYVPYQRFYRLNEYATQLVVDSDPKNPIPILDPPPDAWREDTPTDQKGYGHRYGALIMIMPREAIDVLGCFDERFVGWGGEDVAILRALDTLYGKHKTIDGPVYHLLHPKIGTTYPERQWEDQIRAGSNNELAMRYHRATGKPFEMRELVDEGCDFRDGHSFAHYEISREEDE